MAVSTNTFNKASWVAMKGLSLLKNSLSIGKYFSDEYAGEYAKQYAIGKTLTVPLSQRYNGQRNDMSYNPEALDRPVTTITVDQTDTIALQWDDIEKALDMERGEERVTDIYLKPAIAYIRQQIESDLAQFAGQNANLFIQSALGTNPTTFDGTSAAALQALVEMGVPMDDDNLGLFLPPAVNRSVKTGSLTYFNPTLDLSKQFRTGYVQKSDSFDWYASNSLYRHTAGTWAGAVSISGGGQSGSSLTLTCTTGDTFNQGDKFTIANVNQVNLMTRIATSTATAGTKGFTITAPTTGASSAATISIYPPIYGPGSHYQNVDALPADTAALTLWTGTSSPNGKKGFLGLGLYPGAFFVAGLPLEEPESVEICRQYQDPETGIAIRFIRDWIQLPGQAPFMANRLDALWGRGIGLAEQCAVVIPCA